MTWNLQGSRRTNIAAVAEVASSADVLLLQEVRPHQVKRLARQMGFEFQTWTLKHSLLPSPLWKWFGSEGLAIISRWPLQRCKAGRISRFSGRWSWRRRVACAASVKDPQGQYWRIVNMHLTPPHGGDIELVSSEARYALATMVAPRKRSERLVAGGDLNVEAEQAERIFGAVPALVRVGSACTSPAANPVEALDHLFVPNDTVVTAVEVPDGGPKWDGVSDHLPVAATVEAAAR